MEEHEPRYWYCNQPPRIFWFQRLWTRLCNNVVRYSWCRGTIRPRRWLRAEVRPEQWAEQESESNHSDRTPRSRKEDHPPTKNHSSKTNTGQSHIDPEFQWSVIIRSESRYATWDLLRYLRREDHTLTRNWKIRQYLVKAFHKNGLCRAITPLTRLGRGCKKREDLYEVLDKAEGYAGKSNKKRVVDNRKSAQALPEKEDRRSRRPNQRELDKILTVRYEDVLCIEKGSMWDNGNIWKLLVWKF